MCCVMSWKRLCIMKLLIDYRRPTNQESLCTYWNLYTGYFVSRPTRTTQWFALAFIIEIAVINRLHCFICHFRALWGDHGMLTLTLNLIITSKRSLMNCRNKMKKTWQKICCRVTFHCIEAWHHNVKRYGALAFSNTKLEKCRQALVSWKLYPAYTTILKSYHVQRRYNLSPLLSWMIIIFMHSHVYVVVNFYLGQFLFFFCLWVW